MKDNIFREESVEQMRTPDDLKKNIQFASPGMWLTLGAILIFLIGACFWCVLAKLETKVVCAVSVKGDIATCYVSEDAPVHSGMTIEIEGEKYLLNEHSEKLVKLRIDSKEDEVALHTMNNNEDGWYNIYEISGFEGLQDGTYKGEIIVDSVSPISFLTNSN